MAHVLHAPRGDRLLHAFAAVPEFLAMIGAALRVSAAVDSRRKPNATDLSILGIAKDALPRI